MSFKKTMKGLPSEKLAANGLLYHDWTAVTACQRECTTRLGMTIQLEQEAYLTEHPEVGAMLKRFIGKIASTRNSKNFLKEAAEHFTKPVEELDKDIRMILNLPPTGPYTMKEIKPTYTAIDDNEEDIKNIILKHYRPEEWKFPSPIPCTPETMSSSFISIITSDTTLPTPEPVPTPEPTLSETMFAVVSNTVDKAIFSHVDDAALRYDTAYVELSKAVEQAMEIPVIEIREDIAELFFNAYKAFEINIMEKERIDHYFVWENIPILYLRHTSNNIEMSFKKTMKGLPSEKLAANGLLYHDWTAVTACQRECTTRLGMTIQLEQEAYLTEHPEVGAMLKRFIGKIASTRNSKNFLKEAAEHFTKPVEELDKDIRMILNLPPTGPYTMKEIKPTYTAIDDNEEDIKNIILKHYRPEEWKFPSPIPCTPETMSSSFISIITSDTTLPTPEPVPTPEPTLSETMFAVVSNTVDKAIFSHVDDAALRYDTAYVELSKAVEQAMEIPVIEIREDIAELFFNAYKAFEINIMEKERIAAEIAWEKRMRKKLKRSLRRQKNFRGYETPPTPKSEISSHESYKKPPPKPCKCHPQFHYNRYAKDRFGIYLPKEGEKNDLNVTATPVYSSEDLEDDENDEKADTKSIMSKKSAVSGKGAVSKKTTFEN